MTTTTSIPDQFEASGLTETTIEKLFPGFLDDFDPSPLEPQELQLLADALLQAFEVVEPKDYPPLRIESGTFSRPVEEQWHDYHDEDAIRERIENAIAATGQVRVGLDKTPIGTAWLLRRDLVVTARHVAVKFAEPHDEGFRLKLDAGGAQRPAHIDFLDETPGDPPRAVTIVRPIWIEPGAGEEGMDFALFEVDANHTFPHLVLEPDLPTYPNQRVAVVGFPSPGLSVVPIDPAVVAEYFGGVYWVKRMSPGLVIDDCNKNPWEFCINATSEDGSSGSAVVDVTTGQVVGVHRAGSFGQQNRAVHASFVFERIQQLVADGVLGPV